MLDRFTIIRSVDARPSNHEPNTVFLTANLAAEPRVHPESNKYPSLASVVAEHGQVIGATKKVGGAIRNRPVTPADLAATIFRYFGVPQDYQDADTQGRPRYVIDSGAPIGELF